jgi:branched-chain amino acid transport system permease protein
MEYFLHILILISIYTILAVSLDLLAGQAGLLSVAHAAFYGLGAYTSALLTINFGTPFYVGILAGMAVAALASFIVSLSTLRLHDDYFVIATFGFQVIVSSLLDNWIEVTNGPLGVADIPRPSVFGWTIRSGIGFAILTSLCAFFAYFVVHRISTSPFGRVLRAIREDEVSAQTFGRNTLRFKATVFAVSTSLAALAGSLYAHYVTYIDPTIFTVTESILVISILIFGGADSKWGPLVGAVVLITLPETLRFIGLPNSVAANLRQMLYGVLLIVMLMLRPRGLMGRYVFGK